MLKNLKFFLELVKKYTRPLFLIDTEGSEIEVLKSIPSEIIRKSDFVIEATNNDIIAFKRLIKKESLKLEEKLERQDVANFFFGRVVYGKIHE